MQTLSVACKIPNGLILHTYRGGEKVELKINGNRLPVHPTTGREIQKFEVIGAAETTGVGGYGLTHNVDRDLWDKIEAESRDTPPFKNGLVWAVEGAQNARDMAKDMAPAFRTGMDPIDPDKTGVDKVEKRTED